VRTPTVGETAILGAATGIGAGVTWFQVFVKDTGGNWINLSSQNGILTDWVTEVVYGEKVDDPVATAEFSVVRAVRYLSLASLMQSSKWNRVTTYYSPLLFPGREVLIETALVPRGVTPAAGDWRQVFDGYIDDVEDGGDPIKVRCRDLGGRMQDAWIEEERIYGWTPLLSSLPAWAPSTVYGPWAVVHPTAGSTYHFTATSRLGCTSGTVEPTWTFAIYDSIADAVNGWICLGTTPTQYGAKLWQAGMAVAVGDVVAFPYQSYIDPNRQEYFVYRCATAGTTGTVAPVMDGNDWLTYIHDGSAYWARMNNVYWPDCAAYPACELEDIIRQIWGDWYATGNSLQIPTPSNWAVTPYTQARRPVLEALRNLAAQIGWDFRHKWNVALGAFSPTLVSPNRSKVATDWQFYSKDYIAVPRASFSLTDIRNAIDVVYSDRSALSTDGVNYQRKTVTVEDGDSIDTYGRRWAEIAEASNSNIDTETEALALATAACSDLCNPTVEMDIELHFHFYPVELGDLYLFLANGVHFDTNQSLAVVGYQHTLKHGECRTTLNVRGSPTLGKRVWLSRITTAGTAKPARLNPPAPPCSLTITNAAGRSRVSFAKGRNSDAQGALLFELHIGANGFVPSPASFVESTGGNAFTVFRAAGTYYAKLITRDQHGNVSAPSAQFTLVPT
jgi:hypothetical protein